MLEDRLKQISANEDVDRSYDHRRNYVGPRIYLRYGAAGSPAGGNGGLAASRRFFHWFVNLLNHTA
jgi:hypothetical protein